MSTMQGRPARRRMKAEERRAQITTAAVRLFGQRGYWGTSLQDIAEACDFTVTGVLYHFGSKEKLLREVLEVEDRSYIDQVAASLGGDGSTFHLGQPIIGVDIATLCRVLVTAVDSDMDRTRFYSRLESESTNAHHPAHDHFLRREQKLLDSYEMTVPRSADSNTVARMAMALISGLRVQWLRDPEGVDLMDTWEEMVAGIPALRR